MSSCQLPMQGIVGICFHVNILENNGIYFFTTVAPKGKRINLPILKYTIPIGIPTIVTQYKIPVPKCATVITRPIGNQMIFKSIRINYTNPLIFSCPVTSVSLLISLPKGKSSQFSKLKTGSSYRGTYNSQVHEYC